MRFAILDVFTDRALAGNQLAVFEDGPEVPAHLLQPLAREINFSETVYVYPPADPANTARIRIFVPTNEIPFAGHPVLGTAVLLAARWDLSEVRLETGRGVVPVRVDGGHGTMEQPVPGVEPYPEPERLLAALGLERSLLPVDVYDNGMPHVYVMAESPAEVARLRPDATALTDLSPEGGLGFNCFAGAGTEFTTRMFAPADGIPEDPATGSAAGPLACHLARHGVVPWGAEITIAQGVEMGRPSVLLARAEGDGDRIRAVQVGGDAVLVGDGRFSLPD
jgi:trans-2,3-dihydro-3-hydroxyanthranilate isomerase